MSEKKIEVTFDQREPKKHSVRFNCTDAQSPVASIYIANAGISKIGNPAKIKITIEAV